MTGALYDVEALRMIEGRAGAGPELMERAGQAAWRVLLDHWPQAQRIAVVCGPGNNGGDGAVLALHAHASGRKVLVVSPGSERPRTELADGMQARVRAAGIRIDCDVDAISGCDLVVDALFGIGLARAPDGPAARAIRVINASALPVLSLDVPSGVSAASGDAYDPSVRATHTIEFIACKAGLRTGAARGRVGRVSLAPLGLDASMFQGVPSAAIALSAPDLGAVLGPRALDSHKGMHGRALCVGGDVGHGGAILLAAEAALRCGAGLVDIETRARHVAPALARLPESMPRADVDAGALRRRIEQATTCVLGPGLGQAAWGLARFELCIAHANQLVLDADALNLLAARPVALPAGTILTPHPGEAARLLGCDTAQVQADRFGAARNIARRYSAIVVLKGAGTIVANPGGASYLIDAGNPGMAVGGMGDVLTGAIGALRAQGLSPRDAASMGALLHAAAGDAAARGGERGLLPTDLMRHLRCLANPVVR